MSTLRDTKVGRMRQHTLTIGFISMRKCDIVEVMLTPLDAIDICAYQHVTYPRGKKDSACCRPTYYVIITTW